MHEGNCAGFSLLYVRQTVDRRSIGSEPGTWKCVSPFARSMFSAKVEVLGNSNKGKCMEWCPTEGNPLLLGRVKSAREDK